MIQANILYSGTVQGVGFRYGVHRYAVNLGIKGWVRNLPNGSVEILAEGSKDAVQQLCENIEEHFQGYIKDKQISSRTLQEKREDFKVII